MSQAPETVEGRASSSFTPSPLEGEGRGEGEAQNVRDACLRQLEEILKEHADRIAAICIEPMLNQGSAKVKTKKDGWTVVTRDKKLSAQWEHTVAVTETGVEVLTLRPEEQALLNH